MHYLGHPRHAAALLRLRRYEFIPPSAHTLNAFITVVALIVGAAQLVFVVNLVWSAFRGRRADGNPWRAASLEWQTPQTPPVHGNWGRAAAGRLSLGLRLQRAGRAAGLHPAERAAGAGASNPQHVFRQERAVA